MIADTDLAFAITAIGGAIAAVVGAVFAGIATLRTGRVHREVRTMNELTLGQLGEAAETRRISDKPDNQRTTRERRHIDSSQERSTGA
jgi:hypothetical protein